MKAPLTISLRTTKRAAGREVFYDKLVAHVGGDVAARGCNTLIPIETFVCDCAERLLPSFEATFPKDARPRMAIRSG